MLVKMPPTFQIPSDNLIPNILIPNYYYDVRFIAGFITGFAAASIIFTKLKS